MEKILVLINANCPDAASIDFACKTAGLTRSKLTGLFIKSLPYIEHSNEEINGSWFERIPDNAVATVAEGIDHSVALFKERCMHKGIIPEVYIDKGKPVREVILESRFADLLIVDPELGLYGLDDQLPSRWVKEILTKSECPVILPPEKFEDIDEIVFCYNSSASSVFAIRQFTYLFPEFSYKKVTLLEVNRPGKDEFNEGHTRMMTWLRRHYDTVYYNFLKGEVKEELLNYFVYKPKKMIVMGAYGRSFLSSLFNKSNADVLIRMIDLPIFITHY